MFVNNNHLNEKVILIEPEILDKEEKEYLSAVIKPFRNKVEYIDKEEYDGQEFLNFVYKINSSRKCWFSLPYFKKGTMYRGMQLYKEYTLKDLKL